MKPVWEGRKVVIAVGTGGVGKTTVSASIALAAAASGKRTLVMTIDPARRLANALGITGTGNTEHELTAEMLAQHGIEVHAPLWAMMPDVKSTFDRLVERFAPNSERRDAILRNRIYEHFSTALAGSLEYAAVERLHEVYASGRYDVIVLDTPPSQNVVDFLNAPNRILDFLEHQTLQWLIKPYSAAGRFSIKLLDLGSSFILKTLGRLAGAETLRELAEFVMSFQGMYAGFRERSQAVKTLLTSADVAFVLVGSTTRVQRDSMMRFRHELQREGLRIRSVVLNRVRPAIDDTEWPSEWTQHIREELNLTDAENPGASDRLNEEETEKLIGAIVQEQNLSRRDHETVKEIREELDGLPVLALPELPTDVRDLDSLAELYHHFVVDPRAQEPTDANRRE